MILSFSVENYGPFKNKIMLDFRPSKLSDPSDNIVNTGGHEALSSISIFGPNAVGKSRILHAMKALSIMARYPMPANTAIPFYDPFKLDPHTKGAPTRMSISFVENGIKYDYSMSYNLERICTEELYYSPNGVKSKVFSRNNDNISITTTNISKKLSKIKGQVGRNSTLVSVGAQFNNDICLEVNKAMGRILILTGDMNEIVNLTVKRMNADEQFKRKLIEAMNVADFSISGVEGTVEEKHVMDMRDVIPDQIIGLMMATGSTKLNQMTLNIKHDVSTSGLSDADKTFSYLQESNGTVRMLYIMGPVIDTLMNGYFIAIDEFGAFLDDSLCRWIIQLFRGDNNPNCAQLLVNTHDQLLMDTDELFRRDQIYLVSKSRKTQESDISVLSDYSIRKGYDPRKGFTLGKFGARPIILDEGWSDFEH